MTSEMRPFLQLLMRPSVWSIWLRGSVGGMAKMLFKLCKIFLIHMCLVRVTAPLITLIFALFYALLHTKDTCHKNGHVSTQVEAWGAFGV